MNRKMRAEALRRDLLAVEELSDAQRERIAEALAERYYRREHFAEWVLDLTYLGKSKVVYTCSHCRRWQAAKSQDKLLHMKYCPYCGSRMNTDALWVQKNDSLSQENISSSEEPPQQ